MSFHVPEKYRQTHPVLGDGEGNNGYFRVRIAGKMVSLNVIASDGVGWEHVSVSLPDRCPTWNEMCFIKSMFWDDCDLVVQYPPPKRDYVNNHSFCLHLWRSTAKEIPATEAWMVGVR